MSGKTFQTQRIYGHGQRKMAFLVWVLYQAGRLSLGLALHPYRTVREIMRGVWFVPLVFLPSSVLVWILVSGRLAAWVIDVPEQYREIIGLFYASFILSLLFWQGLLAYLAVRFGMGLRPR